MSKKTVPRIGDKIKVLKDIESDGEECHPPGNLARTGEILTVKKLRGFNVYASHDPMSIKSILVFDGEYEILMEPRNAR